MRSIVLQDLKHSREGLDGRGLDRRCLDRKGLSKSGIDGRADDVRENHRPQHSNVTGKFLSISSLRIILCAKSAEDCMQNAVYKVVSGHPSLAQGKM